MAFCSGFSKFLQCRTMFQVKYFELISMTWISLDPQQYNMVGLFCGDGLPWDMLGLRPCNIACRVECVQSSLCLVVTSTINQPSTMSLIPSTELQKKNVRSFNWYMLQWRPLTHTLHITSICQELIHTDIATPGMVTFYPCPWDQSVIGVSLSPGDE